MSYRVVFTKQAQKDAKKISASGLRAKAEQLIQILHVDPYRPPLFFEKLVGDLAGACSRRITIQHRLVYEVNAVEKAVKIIRMWTQYE